MSLTREDLWRELELLPAWKLRAPVANPVAEPIVATPATKMPELTKIVETKQADIQALLALQSDDKKWVFALPSALTGETEALFNNILLALRVNKTHIASIEKTMVEKIEAKVVLAMGEIAAQQLLNSVEPLEKLRGKTHTIKHLQVIVTYHPNDLLQDLAYKAKMWDDLIMANDLAFA